MTSLKQEILSNKSDTQLSFSQQLTSVNSCSAAFNVVDNYKQLQTMSTLLQVYAELLPEASKDELIRIGGLIVDYLPDYSELTPLDKKNTLFELYAYYLNLFIVLDKWIQVERKILASLFVELVISQYQFEPHKLFELLSLISNKLLVVKDIRPMLDEMKINDEYVYLILEKLGLEQQDNSSIIVSVVNQLMSENPKEVQQYKEGNQKVIGFFVGRIMKAGQGKFIPAEVNKILKEELEK
jgi:Asp-tRNA(Asn)/Glu-tRNA(Gln) amidotransferase B subunit